MRPRQASLKTCRKILVRLITLSWAVLLVCSCVVASADKPTTSRIGLLAGANTFNSAMDGFRAGMTELGYIEGETISYDFQSAQGDHEQMKVIAEEFVAAEIDLIMTTTTRAAQEARTATAESQIPVVFTIVSDPVGSHVVADLRRPGGNITGATRSLSGLISKRVVLLHEIVPELKGIWLPYEEGYPNAGLTLQAVHKAADPLEIAVVETPIRSVEGLIAELERLSVLEELDFDAIKISPDPTVQNEESMAAIMAFAQAHQLPIVANTPDQVRKGALLTYSDDTYQSGYLAASLADKILQGSDPGVIPIAFIEPNLYINYQTAQTLGLAIDESLLAQAGEIIR